jgi:hypothetical protein
VKNYRIQSRLRLFSGKEIALPMTLRPGRTKMVFLLAGALALMSSGFLMLEGGDKMMAYLGIGFFGLCSLVFVAQLLTGNSYLLIESHQFTISVFSRKSVVAWLDVAQFRVGDFDGHKKVGWIYQPDSIAARSTGGVLSTWLTGVQGVLPDNYGLEVDELCALMNELRALRANSVI